MAGMEWTEQCVGNEDLTSGRCVVNSIHDYPKFTRVIKSDMILQTTLVNPTLINLESLLIRQMFPGHISIALCL